MERIRCCMVMLIAAAALACDNETRAESTASGGAGAAGGGGTGATTGGSGGAPGPVCSDYDDPSLYLAPVSFIADVLPLLQANCSLSMCHGTTVGADAGLTLGQPMPQPITQAVADLVHGELVGVPATKATLSRVAAGEPAQSFFIIKIDANPPVSCLPPGASCLGVSCGSNMPAANEGPLTLDDKAVLRTWVRDGALND
jgi:hypothetical protein